MARINYEFYDNMDIYNDGNVEEELLKFYKDGDEIDFSRDDIFFSTTYIRENIINWYPFKKNCSILEIGAGMGAVTGALLKKAKRVVSVEGSKRRSEVLYQRYKKYENLDVFCANFNKLEINEKFDYVVLVGVFEYSPLYCNSSRPFFDFLKKIKSYLNKGGKILIAIENRLGIKYFDGLSEDHYRKPYVGIEGYKEEKIKTFGRIELSELFQQLGLKSKFYGAFPDYKLPNFIFSEDYSLSNYQIDSLTYYNYYDDLENFDFREALKNLNKNNLLFDFSNSFFIEISEEDNFSNVQYVKFTNERDRNYAVATIIEDDAIKKIPLTNDAINHLDELVQTHRKLNDSGISVCHVEKKDDEYLCEKIYGITLQEKIENYLKKGETSKIFDLLDKFYDYVIQSSIKVDANNLLSDSLKVFGDKINVLPLALLDLHLDNIIEDENGNYILIDQEWVSSKQLPIEYNLFVSISLLYGRFPELNNISNVQYFYDKYGLTSEKISVIIDTGQYFFNSIKKFKNYDVDNLLKFRNTANNISLFLTDTVNEKKYYLDLVKFYKSKLSVDEKIISEQCRESQKLDNSVNVNDDYSFYLTMRLNNLILKILPYGSLRRKVVKVIVKNFIKILHLFRIFLKCLFKSLFYLIPSKKIKRKIFYKCHFTKKFSSLFGTDYYVDYSKYNVVIDHSMHQLNNLSFIRGSIAVHIHLFYEDLSDEFYRYLLNIPYQFDLYISLSENGHVSRIKRKFSKLLNVHKIVVKRCNNIGRDYGPMFYLFGDDLKKYDYLLHIHSKKSLRTGSEQSRWRRYMLDHLIGSKEIVMNYFDLMENYNIGLAYPDTFDDLPYIAHTWLKSFGFAQQYLSKIEGIELKDEYLNFSAGSMFWCRVEAIRDLFDLNLKREDFGVEDGKDEGTLAHMLERCFGLVCKKNHFNYASFNAVDGKFYINKSVKNMYSYFSRSYQSTLNDLNQFSVITFDIFDTLIARKLYNSDDVFEIIDLKISKIYGFKAGEFKKNRKKAENNIRKKKNYIGDCTINEIYDELKCIMDLTINQMNELKKIEIETDIHSMIPRFDMLSIYNELIKRNKKIILISDMYYTKDIIEKILHRYGYYNYYDILISSEVGYRKDNGTMWKFYFDTYPDINSVHVGDNESSDIHTVMCMQKPNLHIMQGKKMYQISNLYCPFDEESLDNRIMMGIIINKSLFNSPFALHNDGRGDIVKSLYDYGFSILGPIILYFMIWLINHLDNKENILFASREGYYLQKIFRFVISKTHKNINISDIYLLTSRRASTVANIHTSSDIENILDSNYTGTLKEMMYNRFGYILNESYSNEFITLPDDKAKVMSIIGNEISAILKQASQERENYLKYLNKKLDINQEYCLVDLGYSGTTQFELSKLLNKKISGKYFVVSDKVKPLSIGCIVDSCFNKIISNNGVLSTSFGKYSLFLESFFTANCGQLIKFNDKIEPVFMEDNNPNIYLLNQIYDGIIAFIDEMSDMVDKDILDINLDINFLEKYFSIFVEESNSFNPELLNTLKLEDLYVANSENMNFLDIYR